MARIRSVFALGLAAAMLAAASGIAEAKYPEKPVTMIIPFRAGGSTDITARVLAKYLEKYLGQPFISVNKPGGGGAIGSIFVKSKAPDGYTIMMNGSLTYTFLPQFSKKVKFAHDDFTHIATITKPQGSLVTRPGPWADFTAMVDKFKTDEKAIAFPVQIPLARLFASVVSKQTGIKFKIVPVKGSAAAGQQLLGGHADIAWAAGWHLKHVKAGKMQVVASTGAKRLTYAKNIRTVGEMGYESAYLDFIFMLSGPKGMPKDVVDTLSAAIKKAIKEPELIKLYKGKFSFDIVFRSPEETEKYVVWEKEKYAAFIAAAAK